MTRYRLDSQFRCLYLESRGVPEKTAGNTDKKTREIISLSFPVMQLPVAHAHAITSGTPKNDKWMVLLYYYRKSTRTDNTMPKRKRTNIDLQNTTMGWVMHRIRICQAHLGTITSSSNLLSL